MKFLLLLTLILSSSYQAAASISERAENGEGAGNGGGAWACHEGSSYKEVRWIKFIDLFEASREFSLPMKDFTGMDFELIVELQLARLSSISGAFADNVKSHLNIFLDNIKEIDADLEVIDDSLYRIRPSKRECEGGIISYVQLANYTNYDAVLVDKFYINHTKLSAVDKAALYLHEAVYSFLRTNRGDKNSVRTRQILGYLFSDKNVKESRDSFKKILGFMGGSFYGLEFVRIKVKDFEMGSPLKEEGRRDDERQRLVKLSNDFEMMTTEVSQSMYFSVTGKNPSYFSNINSCRHSFESVISPVTGNLVKMCPNLPVEGVSFNDIQSFILLLNKKTMQNYRLPTEAEWEYAARGSEYKSPYWWGDRFHDYRDHAIPFYGPESVPASIGKLKEGGYEDLKPNRYGLYDMIGNIGEVVQDWYEKHPRGGIDPKGPISGSYNVVRGYPFSNRSKDFARVARRARRDLSSYGSSWVGFRLVRTLPSKTKD